MRQWRGWQPKTQVRKDFLVCGGRPSLTNPSSLGLATCCLCFHFHFWSGAPVPVATPKKVSSQSSCPCSIKRMRCHIVPTDNYPKQLSEPNPVKHPMGMVGDPVNTYIRMVKSPSQVITTQQDPTQHELFTFLSCQIPKP